MKTSLLLPIGLVVLCMSLGSGVVAAQGTDVTVAIIPLAVTGPDDFANTLPVAQTDFPFGDMVVEVWAQTMAPAGLAQVSIDFGFPPSAFTVTSLTRTPTFSTFPNGTIDNVIGVIDDLSGSVLPVVPACGGQVGATPQWARVAVINMQAIAGGSRDLLVGPTNTLVFVNGNCGSLSAPVVTFIGATVTINSAPLPIPTLSSWGMLVITLLMFAVGTLVFSRRATSAIILSEI